MFEWKTTQALVPGPTVLKLPGPIQLLIALNQLP